MTILFVANISLTLLLTLDFYLCPFLTIRLQFTACNSFSLLSIYPFSVSDFSGWKSFVQVCYLLDIRGPIPGRVHMSSWQWAKFWLNSSLMWHKESPGGGRVLTNKGSLILLITDLLPLSCFQSFTFLFLNSSFWHIQLSETRLFKTPSPGVYSDDPNKRYPAMMAIIYTVAILKCMTSW